MDEASQLGKLKAEPNKWKLRHNTSLPATGLEPRTT